MLFNKQFQDMQKLNAVATFWMNGFSKLGIDNSRRPTARVINEASQKYTGYKYIQTSMKTIMSKIDWYEMVAKYQMPLTIFVRKPSELEYCDEPDFFHDVMGHIAMYIDKDYSDMIQKVAKLYIRAYYAKRDDILKDIDFINDYVIELGLIREPSGVKAFGATLYSSGEVKEAFEKNNQRTLGSKIPNEKLAYDRSKPQGKYYIIESIDQINRLLTQIERRF